MSAEPCAVHQQKEWEAWRERLVLRGGESPGLARMCDDCRSDIKERFFRELSSRPLSELRQVVREGASMEVAPEIDD